MAKSILDKYKSIDQTKISKEAKTILLKIKVKTKNFKETTPETNKVFNTFYSKLEQSKPQAIKGYKEPAKAAPKAAPKASSKKLTAAQLLKEAKKRRANQGISTSKSDIEKDAARPAKPKGYRITDGTNYPYVKGNKYWEGRENRLDRKQPPKKYPKLEHGGYMEDGGYVAVGEKDGYWTIMSKPTSKEKAHEVINMGVPRGETGKVVTLKEAKEHKKVIGAEYLEHGGIMAKGGGIYSSDSLYILTVSKDGKKVGEERFQAKNVKEAREMGEDYEDEYKSKFGGDLSFSVNKAMAKGGKLESGVYRVGKPSKVSENLYEQKIVEIFDNGDIATASDYGRKMSDFSSYSYKIISKEQLDEQYKMEHGGYMAKGGEIVPYIVWVQKKDGGKRELYGEYKSMRAANMKMDKLWESGEYERMGNKPKSMYEKEGFYKDGGYMAKGGMAQGYDDREDERLAMEYGKMSNKDLHSTHARRDDARFEKRMAKGGEVGQGFLIREMREKLNRMFPDSFGFTVGNVSKEGDIVLNSAALIVDSNDPYRGLEDKDIQSKLFFPQYKRDHNINFRVMQGGENTYFYFELESEKGDEYIGQFGFKDSGDVPSSYITSFIAFLMEQYGLPFQIEHQVMAHGGKVGEPHRIEIGG